MLQRFDLQVRFITYDNSYRCKCKLRDTNPPPLDKEKGYVRSMHVGFILICLHNFKWSQNVHKQREIIR